MGRAFNYHVGVDFDEPDRKLAKSLGIDPKDTFVFQSAGKVKGKNCKEVRLSIIAKDAKVLQRVLDELPAAEMNSKQQDAGTLPLSDKVKKILTSAFGGLQVLGCCSKSRDVEVILVGDQGLRFGLLVDKFFVVTSPANMGSQEDDQELKNIKVTAVHAGPTSCEQKP
jgi:hypothetical protein